MDETGIVVSVPAVELGYENYPQIAPITQIERPVRQCPGLLVLMTVS